MSSSTNKNVNSGSRDEIWDYFRKVTDIACNQDYSNPLVFSICNFCHPNGATVTDIEMLKQIDEKLIRVNKAISVGFIPMKQDVMAKNLSGQCTLCSDDAQNESKQIAAEYHAKRRKHTSDAINQLSFKSRANSKSNCLTNSKSIAIS